MERIFMNNCSPNEITLGSLIFNKIKNDGYISCNDDSLSFERNVDSCRKINLPDYLTILDNRISVETKTHRCSILNIGEVKYNSFDKNFVIFGRFCEVYKIHKIMQEHGTEHFYNGNIINYFDL